MTERRTREGYKLRIYIDQIKTVRAMTDEQWMVQAVSKDSASTYMTRDQWVTYLQGCALQEAESFLKSEAA